MSDQNSCQQTCNEHGTIITKINMLEKTVDELKKQITLYVEKEVVEKQIKYIEGEIKDLKDESAKHYEDNVNLQKMLAHLDEFTKSLKETLALNQKATEQLMEKIDKMYDLMLNFKYEGNSKDSDNTAKNEIKIINDSNNKSSSEKDNDKSVDVLGFIKDYGTIILILVAVIAYLVTGHWPLPIGE